MQDFGHRIGTAAKAGSLLPEANPQLSIISGPAHDRLKAIDKGHEVSNAVQAGFDNVNKILLGAQIGATKGRPGTDIELGALKGSHEELTSLITLARGLVAAADALGKRGPDQTNVTIHETKDPRATARATIAELRADRMLLRGVR
jgi:hypothetical protein